MLQLLYLFCLLILSYSPEVAAKRIEQLVMPGKLMEHHAPYENECEVCHKDFTKEAQSGLCQACHDEIKFDVEQHKGYHGDALIRDRECSECHTDHIGRDADIVVFEASTFNHKQTDFELNGFHKQVPCESCHTPDIKYRDAKNQCYACHFDDEPHKGFLGKQCDDCHNEENWQELDYAFDHNQTDFPLRFKHKDVNCESCHTESISKLLSIECVTCHIVNDVHGGRYGERCQDCHTEMDWDKGKFDHDQTKFPLRFTHKDLACDACHTDPIFDKEMKRECVACHKKDDTHRGQNGKVCNECHRPTKWNKFRFNHDTTDFPLHGKHKDLECTNCHKGDIYKEDLKTSCVDCHVDDDVHKEDQGKECSDCHVEDGWNQKVIFDHDMTGFPLVGLHATAPCEECHLSHVYSEAKLQCDSCHRLDDVHEEKLGKACITCHNPNGWGIWEFDHNTQTEYVLDGEHENLDCHACHTEPVKGEINMLTTCFSCHEKDDIHNGSLTRYCERCHVTRGFEEIRVVR